MIQQKIRKKRLEELELERRTSLHEVQYKWQPGSILMFFANNFKND